MLLRTDLPRPGSAVCSPLHGSRRAPQAEARGTGAADLPGVTRAIYPVGFFGFLFLNTLFNQWVVCAHASAGPLLMVGYAAQGLASPFWGHLGDRVRARFGSRRLVTVLAAPLVIAAFAGALDADAPVALVLAYCLSFSVALQPYLALIPTLAPTDAERGRAMSLGMAFALGAAAAALALPRRCAR